MKIYLSFPTLNVHNFIPFIARTLIASGSGVVGNSPILAAAISGAKTKESPMSSNMYKVKFA